MRLLAPLLALALVVLVAYTPTLPNSPSRGVVADTTWSWPDTLENAQVFPSDVGAERLRSTMVGFTRSLGVRCQYCHVGEEGEDFATWDFAADDKPTKDVARGMMEMTWQINTQALPAMEGLPTAEEWRVTCWTCHRGATVPDK